MLRISNVPAFATVYKGRDTLGDKSLQHVAATSCCNMLSRVTWYICASNFAAAISRTKSNQFAAYRIFSIKRRVPNKRRVSKVELQIGP